MRIMLYGLHQPANDAASTYRVNTFNMLATWHARQTMPAT